MNAKRPLRDASLRLVALASCLAALQAQSAVFWQHGVHSNDISVCFVGDSFSANNAFATLVMDYMREFEWYSGIRFTYINGGVCPAAVPHPVLPGLDYYEGTIRIVIPGVTTVSPFGWVQGAGCPHNPAWENPDGTYNGENDDWGSWANPPDDLELRRSCIYNVKLGDSGDISGVPWRNHTLHEIGHAVGLHHEHIRSDANAGCTEDDYGGSTSTGWMTPYDRDSVMHYNFPSCSIDGNWGHGGLSAWDRLALHIMYPETNLLAEFHGNLLVRSDDTLDLTSAWRDRGALINNVASNFQWYLDGIAVGSDPDLSLAMPAPAVHSLLYRYDDNLVTVSARSYEFAGSVRVLPAEDYDRLMGAIANIGNLLTSTGMEDADGDGVPDIRDNCLGASNAAQIDTDRDGIGNVCDADIAIPNDCIVNFADLGEMRTAFFTTPRDMGWNPDADFNGDDIVNFVDLLVLERQFFDQPGPSATGCN